MRLTGWQAAGWLGEHRPTPEETRALLDVIDRDLRDIAVAANSPDSNSDALTTRRCGRRRSLSPPTAAGQPENEDTASASGH